jgi:hypothetical protein
VLEGIEASRGLDSSSTTAPFLEATLELTRQRSVEEAWSYCQQASSLVDGTCSRRPLALPRTTGRERPEGTLMMMNGQSATMARRVSSPSHGAKGGSRWDDFDVCWVVTRGRLSGSMKPGRIRRARAA